MAASHIFHQVMTTNSFAMETSATPSSTLATNAATSNRPSAMSPGRTSNKLIQAATTVVVTPSTTMSGGRFISRILEKGGLPGIVENLRDGQTKLQQAYLNIVNTILCPNLYEYSNGSARDGTSVSMEELTLASTGSNSIDGIALKPIRAYLLKAGGLLPVLPRLIEQGGSSATRAKALLSCQLLCLHNHSVLSLLAEKRLTYVLMRSLEPVLTYQGLVDDGSSSGGADANNDSTLSTAAPASINYSVKISMSMVILIKSIAGSLLLLSLLSLLLSLLMVVGWCCCW